MSINNCNISCFDQDFCDNGSTRARIIGLVLVKKNAIMPLFSTPADEFISQLEGLVDSGDVIVIGNINGEKPASTYNEVDGFGDGPTHTVGITSEINFTDRRSIINIDFYNKLKRLIKHYYVLYFTPDVLWARLKEDGSYIKNSPSFNVAHVISNQLNDIVVFAGNVKWTSRDVEYSKKIDTNALLNLRCNSLSPVIYYQANFDSSDILLNGQAGQFNSNDGSSFQISEYTFGPSMTKQFIIDTLIDEITDAVDGSITPLPSMLQISGGLSEISQTGIYTLTISVTDSIGNTTTNVFSLSAVAAMPIIQLIGGPYQINFEGDPITKEDLLVFISSIEDGLGNAITPEPSMVVIYFDGDEVEQIDAPGNYQVVYEVTEFGRTTVSPIDLTITAGTEITFTSAVVDDEADYVANGFVGEVALSNLSVIETEYGLSKSFLNDLEVNGQIIDSKITGTTLIIAGQFTQVQGEIRNKIASIDLTTGLVTSWDPNADGDIYSIAVNGSSVYVAGLFNNIGGQSRAKLAEIDLTTGLATSWDVNSDNHVFSIAINGTSIYAAGAFDFIGGQSRAKIAELDLTTGLATSWDPNAFGGVVGYILINGSSAFAFGNFNFIGGQPRAKIAELDLTTGLATSWDPNPNNSIIKAEIVSSGLLFLGTFSEISGESRNGIALYDNLLNLLPWEDLASAGARGNSALQIGSHLYVGITNYGTGIFNKFNTNGERQQNFNSLIRHTTDPLQVVASLLEYDGNIIVMGRFNRTGANLPKDIILPYIESIEDSIDGTVTPTTQSTTANGSNEAYMVVEYDGDPVSQIEQEGLYNVTIGYTNSLLIQSERSFTLNVINES